MGILNIYNPNDQYDRRLLLQEISLVLPRHCRWILGGNFNMVETLADKSNIYGRLINNQDPFRSGRGLKFSWDNGRAQGERILARLDRFYLFNNPATGPTRIIPSYAILGGCLLSDHHPVRLQLQLGDSPRNKGTWKMNVKYLDETKDEVTRMWRFLPSSNFSFFAKIRKVMRFYRSFCIQKAMEFKTRESMLRQELTLAQTELQSDPFSGRW
jgi:hypothetical protein